MTLNIIGSGFGRTGTMSTKMALNQLGLGTCHHMSEVMGDPEQPPFWSAYVAGESVDWQAVFAKYTAQVDFPGAAVWPELVRAFPSAKVIHTERPEEDWWASYSKTIGKFWLHYKAQPMPPEMIEFFGAMDTLIRKGVFGGSDRETCIAAYRRNNALVRETVPSNRLLVFTPSDGWEPLCRFLDVPVPDGDFPRSNSRDEFWAQLGGEPAEA
ncbi:sulfotransferase family protein [Jannaschia sp. CCS1]|uniref:sulfotransferase family protein n=1 Tax=Jannaschia sp. (strain CCS1) TaxID=290400 RepID=UPI000053D082|nr:sulfotransferase family protein [Jannaschia sp. CCS1]ABD56640.1 hypothetical protein Jann_3723 [Jannaschia sp. CCS1]